MSTQQQNIRAAGYPSGKKGPELVASDAGWAFVIVAQALLRLFRGLAGRTHPGPCLYVKSAGTPVVVRCSGLHALRAAKKEPRASHIHMESHKAPPGRTPGTSRPRHKQKATTLCTCTTTDVSDASSKDARETPPDARGNVRDASEDVQDARENLQDARDNLPVRLGCR